MRCASLTHLNVYLRSVFNTRFAKTIDNSLPIYPYYKLQKIRVRNFKKIKSLNI